MKNSLHVLCIFMMVFAFGGIFCNEDESTENCEEVCDFVVDDCGGDIGKSDCVDECVNENDGEDISSSDADEAIGMGCDDLLAMISETTGDNNPASYPNCASICEIIITDCGLASGTGSPGSTVAECTAGCVEDEGGDMSTSDAAGMSSLTCEQIETIILSGDDGGDSGPASYPNCASICEIIITDCGLASDIGSPGSDVAECTTGCVEDEGGDISASDAAMMSSLSCEIIATIVK